MLRDRVFVPAANLLILGLLSGCGGREESAAPSAGGPSFTQQVADAMEDPNVERRAQTLITIGDKQRQNQDLVGADATFSKARRVCEGIEDPATRARMFAFLARGFERAEQKSDAARSAVQSLEAAKAVQEPESKARALVSAAGAFAAAGDKNQAATTLSAARTALEEVPEGEAPDLFRKGKTEILASIAQVHHELQRSQDVDELLTAALEVAGSIESARGRVDAIAAVAVTQQKLKLPAAEETFQQALTMTETIEDQISRGHALVNIAEKYQDLKRYNDAQSLLEKADNLARPLAGSSEKNELMDRIYRVRQGT